MLSDEMLDIIVKPLVDRQEAISLYVIRQLAKRLKEIGMLLPSDVYTLERLYNMGNDVKKINQELARLSLLQETSIKEIIRYVAEDAYKDAKPYYDYRRKPFIPFKDNKPLQRQIQAISRVTVDTYKNLSNSQATGFLIRDLKHPEQLKFQSIGDTYKTVMDEAIQAAQSGVVNYNTAMRRTLKQLTDSGVRKMSWDSGYTQRLDTAVKRNLLSGIREVNQAVQDVTGEQYGADGKEITVHANSAPDHEPIQGHQFTNEEWEKLQSGQPFTDVAGISFEAIDRAIGTLNCRHFAYSIIVGISKPVYTPEQLQKIISDNHRGYTLPNGKHLTMYECTQKQRQMETQIRRLKDAQTASKTAGDTDEAKVYQAKVNSLTKSYRAFSSACELKPKMGNLSVPEYKEISLK